MVNGFLQSLIERVPKGGSILLIGEDSTANDKKKVYIINKAVSIVPYRAWSFDLIYIAGELPDHEYEEIVALCYGKLSRKGILAGSIRSLPRAKAFLDSIWRKFTFDEEHWVSVAPARPPSTAKQRNGLTVSFVVPTYNNVRYTAQLFASLARTTGSLRYEIVVVDNGSTDETLSFVGSHTPGQLRGAAQGENPPKRIKLIHNTKQRALARSWNMGYDNSDAEYVFILNNDIIFTPGAIERMIEVSGENDHVGIVMPRAPMEVRGITPKVVNPYDSENYPVTIVSNLLAVEEWNHGLPQTTTFLPDNYLPQGGYCFLLKRECFETVGRFDEAYELTGEDWDYFSRLRRRFKIARADDAYVEHFEHKTCLSLGVEFHERLCRNRFLLTEKVEGIQHIFSIIMPVYNRSDSLKAAIDSVLAQSFPHWRLYVIDDHSDDTEWHKIQALSRRYENEAGRIWFFHQGENKGPGAARNYGLQLSQGKYVAFLDSDDVWYPDHLARHYGAHESGGNAFVYSTPDFAWRWWETQSNSFLHRIDTHPTIKYFGPFDRDKLVDHNYIQTSSVSAWGELARANTFTEDKMIEEDWDYFKALTSEGRTAYHIDHATCRYHIAKSPHEADHLVKAVAPGLAVDKAQKPTPLVLCPTTAQEPVTIIIPTKNRIADVERAIYSIGSLPFIVIDDGGTNPVGLSDLVRKHEWHGSLYRVSPSVGPSEARNLAAELAKTHWLQFLDDDDTLTAEYWGKMIPLLTEVEYDIVTFASYVAKGNGLAVETDIFTSQVCVRRSAFFGVGGFDRNCSWAEERDLLTRMERGGAKHLNIAAALVIRARRGGSGDPSTSTGLSAQKQKPSVLMGGRRHDKRF